MKYLVTVYSDSFYTKEFASNSRNSIHHLRENGGYKCEIRNKGGKIISVAQQDCNGNYFHCFISEVLKNE